MSGGGVTAMVLGAPAGAPHALQEPLRQPLPVGPPIGGPVWTLLVPAILLVVAFMGTWLLYRHFASEKDS